MNMVRWKDGDSKDKLEVIWHIGLQILAYRHTFNLVDNQAAI